MKIIEPVNVYGNVDIGEDCLIGPFTEIQDGVKIGKGTRVQSHTFICTGVSIGENCRIGHGVMFTNDLFEWKNPEDWILRETNIGNNVKIGSNATILPVNIGDNSIVGAGAVVTKDVPPNSVVVGNPAMILKRIEKYKEKK